MGHSWWGGGGTPADPRWLLQQRAGEVRWAAPSPPTEEWTLLIPGFACLLIWFTVAYPGETAAPGLNRTASQASLQAAPPGLERP